MPVTYGLDEAIRGARNAREYMRVQGIRVTWTNAAVVDRALARGLDVAATRQGRVRLSDGRRNFWFSSGRTNFNRPMAVRSVRFREVASAHLRARGVVAPQNAVFASGDGPRAWQWAEALAPLVVTPSDSTVRTGAHVGLADRAAFLTAFDLVAGEHGKVLVEQGVIGVEHQVTVIDNRVIAATRQLPEHVQDQARATLKPGSDVVDATDELSADEVVLIERAARAFPGLRLAGFHVALPRDGRGEQPCIAQVTAKPLLARHHVPAQGVPHDVAGALLDAMFPTTANTGAVR